MFYLFLGGIFSYLFSSCTGLKSIESSNPLLAHSSFEFKSSLNSSQAKELKNVIADVNLPRPNGKLLWMRPGPAIYNMMGNPKKEKGLRVWIKRKLGRAPVTLKDVDPGNVSAIMENRMFNYGYFNAHVDHNIEKGNRLAEITYSIYPENNYRFDTIVFPSRENQISMAIAGTAGSTLIRKGDPYQLNTLIDEEERIENQLKDSGYYYFDKSLLKFRADTFSVNNGVSLDLFLKPEAPANSIKRMRIGDIVVHDGYSLERYIPDTMHFEGITYLSQGFRTRPELILNEVSLRSGMYYSKSEHLRTLNHLTSLGIYKFVNANFTRDSAGNVLNVGFFMTPQKRNSISAEINAVAETSNYVGPGININWRNRNLFRGAESFTLNLNGLFEVQVGTDSINTSIEIGLDGMLEIPRLVPIRFPSWSPEFMPVTYIHGGIRFYRRVELYTMQSLFAKFGYRWRQNRKVRHDLQVIDFSYTRVTDQTEAFREYLDANPLVKRSFEQQFILGLSYTFTFDNYAKERIKSTYFSASVESAGNLISLMFNTIKGKNESPDDQYTLFGVPYSQFLKFRVELRNYYRIGKNSQLVTRAIVGAGIPYGNSTVLPYIRQFFAGGTNDIRAFVARTVGPGSYIPPVQNLGVDQTGDIKLEASAEYRFSFTRLLKGAFFLDAGNVWLKNDDPERPGASFSFDRFYREIALGSGFGLRIDADFVVLRLDLAWAVYNPNLPEGDRWVIDGFNPFDRSWRKENILLNIAIGYPF